MNNDLNIRIKINSDTKALEITQDGFEKIKQRTGEASESTDQFSSSLGRVAALAATGLGFAGLTASMSDFISTAGKFEQYSVSLKVLSGSSQQAEKSFAWIKDFTAKTPYTLDETTEAFIRLKAYGIDATDGSLKTLGDTSAALAKPLMAAVEAMADAMTGENERLKEFGITASVSGKNISYNWMDSSGQAKTKIIENNKEIIKSTLEAIFNEKYKGMMDEQSKTWVGMVSNLDDSWTSLKDSVAHNTGAFDIAKTTISSLNTVISNQNGELDTLIRYTKDAAAIGATYYGVTLGASALSAVKTLTTAQNGLNLATLAWNRLLAVNPIILGGMALAGGVAYFYDMAQRADEEARKAYQTVLDADKAYSDYYATSEGKASKMGASYIALEKSLSSLENQRKSATGSQAESLDKAIASTKRQMTELQGAAKSIYTEQKSAAKTNVPTEKELKAAAKAAEEYAKNYKSLRDAIFNTNASEHDKALKAIDDQAAEYRKQKLPEVEIARYVSESKTALNRKELEELGNAMNESRKLTEDNYAKSDQKTREFYAKQIESSQSMYLSLNELSDNWYDNEIVRISDRAAEYAATGNDEVRIAEWVSASISEIDKKRFEEQHKFWFELYGNIDKAAESQFFDAMTGRFESFGSWLKDFWSSTTGSLARGLSKSLADSMMSFGKSGLQNVFSGYGIFGNSAASSVLYGSSTDSAGFTTTAGGTVFDAAGQITKQGSDYSSVSNALSNASSINSLSGITGSTMSATSWMSSQGLISGTTAGNIDGFVYGAMNPSSMAGTGGATGAGSILGGAAIGAAGGYALGSIGDKLFGAQTKASSYGATGGAIGAAIGSIVPGIGTLIGGAVGATLGSVIGGMFGKKKSDGVTLLGTTTSDYTDGHFDYVKKSWFSTKRGISSWFSDKDKAAITGVISSYDYLLVQMGVLDKTLAISGGKFASIQDFLDRGVAKTFIDTVTTADTTEMYDAWSDYAKSINKTIQAALTDSINTYVGDTRNFQTWMLERSGNSLEALKLKSEWAAADTANIQKMLGLENVTIDNYLSKYKEAIGNSFDPQTLQNYKTIGEYFMDGAEAADAYAESLKKQLAVQAKIQPADMMISKVKDASGGSTESLTPQLLAQVVRLLSSIKDNQLYGVTI